MGLFPYISLSDVLLLVYRSATDFCIFILYPETLLRSLMRSTSFLMVSLGFSVYVCFMSSANSGSFKFSFSVWIPLVFTGDTMIMGILVLFLILKGMFSAFHW